MAQDTYTINVFRYSHWVTTKEMPANAVGFVYIITNLTNGRKYIGCKKMYVKNKQKQEWQSYTGSSTELNKDIAELGKYSFGFEIIEWHTSLVEMKYSEARHILTENAILKWEYYNQAVFLRMRGKKKVKEN